MAITKAVRDKLLVEARHRCTICAEKCFEIHHIIEQSDGGTDVEENLIVLCPNCHQHRYHRNREFTPDQIRLYKTGLKEKNEIERRLLMNLEEVKQLIGQTPAEELNSRLQEELSAAASLVDPQHSPRVHETVVEMAKELANRRELPGGARQAIELQFEIERQRLKAQHPRITLVGVGDSAWRKSNAFPAAYEFGLVLDQAPNGDWVEVFDHHFWADWYNMKRKTWIDEDRIRMIVADSDDLQRHVDFAKRLVEETNQLIATQGFEEIDRRINAAKAQALREYDTIQALRAKTKDLKI